MRRSPCASVSPARALMTDGSAVNAPASVTGTEPMPSPVPSMRRISLPWLSSTCNWMLATPGLMLAVIGIISRVRPAISPEASASGTPSVSVACRRSAMRAASSRAIDWLATRLLRSRLASNTAAAASVNRAVATAVPMTPTKMSSTANGRMILSRIESRMASVR